MIVEDDAELLEIIGDTLESFGAKTFRAENGFWAFEILLNQKVDVILSDYRMPGCDGRALLGTVRRRDSKLPHFLFLTGYSDLTDEEAIRLGANGLIHKPFEISQLIQALQSVRAAA